MMVIILGTEFSNLELNLLRVGMYWIVFLLTVFLGPEMLKSKGVNIKEKRKIAEEAICKAGEQFT